MPAFQPACLPTAIGSLPLTDPRAACGLMLRCFPAITPWPQLPRLSPRENMYVQFTEGLPGAVLSGDKVVVDREQVDAGLERLYLAYLSDEPGPVGSISRSYAEGLAMLLSLGAKPGALTAIKGQVTGPISLGLQVTDRQLRPILYDEVLADAVAKLLRLKAVWQETQLRRICPQTIIFVDEPYLSAFGSAYVPITREQVLSGLEEVFAGIRGLKGLHCCGNTDWGMLFDTSLDIASFDAYHFAEQFALYAPQIKTFLARGGMIAWGIVPNESESLALETPSSLVERLLGAMDLLVGKGISRDDLLQRALVTASCGLGTLTPDAAIRNCEMTAAVSALLKQKPG